MAKRLRRQLLNPDGHVNVYQSEDGTLRTDIHDALKLTLANLEASYAKGSDPGAPLQAVWLSYQSGNPIPDWALSALADAYGKAVRGDIASWDEAFGRPNTKGQFERFFRDADDANKIWVLVAEAKARGEPVDNLLMEKIGRQGFGGKSKAWKLYELACSWRGKP